MFPLEEVLLELADAVAASASDPASGIAVRVDRARLEVPVEARWLGSGSWLVSLPRHRGATGFDAPFTRLSAVFEEVAP